MGSNLIEPNNYHHETGGQDMAENQSMQLSETIAAPLKQVYTSFTSSVSWEQWFSDFAEVAPVVNGRLYFYWQAGHHAGGVFTDIQEDERLVFTWQGRGESHESEVTITFQNADQETRVTISHTGLGSGDRWEQSIKSIKVGWESSLTNLKSVLETGLDQRLFQRPMLGIYPNQEIDTELAARLKLPVSNGIQIGGVVPGMGAEAAGLQEGDILTALNQVELKAFQDFGLAMAGAKAGQEVKVVYYRQGEKHEVEMTLSHRPHPDIPESPAALAKRIAQAYEQSDAALEKACQDTTEKEASSPPAEGEWSAKETLVHLLYSERWLHLALSCLVTDQRTGGFANQPDMIRAMADSYSLAELVDELKLCEIITVKSIEALPAEVYDNKRIFVRLVDGYGQGFSQHTISHIPQIEAAIAAAREQ
jgi:uncharacterized protein YndB with AHSA1/START domain